MASWAWSIAVIMLLSKAVIGVAVVVMIGTKPSSNCLFARPIPPPAKIWLTRMRSVSIEEERP